MEAHEKGLLHRAFSVFIFNDEGELLLQKRADSKYHSGGLWTNTCCSHPRIDESAEAAGARRLMEEMGFSCPLEKVFTFRYKAVFSNGLSEHEFDHVLFGHYNRAPKPNPEEVSDWKYVPMDKIEEELKYNGIKYTEWFKICFTKVVNHFNDIRTTKAS